MPNRTRRAWILAAALLVIAFAAYYLGLSLASSYYYQAALAALDRRDFGQARLHLEKSLDLDPDDLAVRLALAQTARRQGDLRTAVQQLQVFEEQHGLPEALALEQQLLRVQEGDRDGIDRLLAFCTNHPDVPETPLILEACIEGDLKGLTPAYTEGMLRGAAYTTPELARLQGAIDLWLKLRPGDADQGLGRVWRARVAALANDRTAALASVREAMILAPELVAARLYLALFLAEQDPAEAETHLEYLRAQQPASNVVRFPLATVRRSLGKLEEARQLLDEILADHPEHLLALIERGQLALDLHEPEDAQRWLKRALALAPDDPRVHLALASCHHLAGRAEEARRHQERYQELDAQRRRGFEQKTPAKAASGR